MTKIGKTATSMLDYMRQHQGRYGFSHGLDRGRGGTGKLRSFGTREYNAANELVKAGLARFVSHYRSMHYVKGFGTPSTDSVLELVSATQKD